MTRFSEQFYGFPAQGDVARTKKPVIVEHAQDGTETKAKDDFENKYDPTSEYHVDPESPEVKKKIEEAQQLFLEFLKENQETFDLSNEQSIEDTFNKAIEAGVFDKASEIRELLFGKDVHFYGVSYLWDACKNHCHYCPGSVPNRAKAIKEGKEFPLRELSVPQAVEDTKAVMKDGHTHICYLTGSTPSIDRYPDKIIPYLTTVIEETKDDGLEEIILNVEPLTEEGFRKVNEAVKATNERLGTHVALQFRVFQETYNRDVYAQMHPKGPKADYDFRIESQARALRAGIDNVGLGALFGLNKFPLEEIEGLRQHAERLEKEFGKTPARICLPSANELENIGVKIPHVLTRGTYREGRKELTGKGPYEKFDELIYALARLAMPKNNIVSSERDGEAMLELLDKYATCTTLNVHPGVGDNARLFKKQERDEFAFVHFEQTTTFPRDPKSTVDKMKARGYNPLLGTRLRR